MNASRDNLRLVRVPPSVIAIGTSSGGPNALQKILPLLPADLPVGILIVQHMPPGFIGPLVARLDDACQVIVRVAGNNDLIESGVVYIAPAGQHMTIYRRTASQVNIRLSHSPEGTLHRPSVDVMMLSVAEVFPHRGTFLRIRQSGEDLLQPGSIHPERGRDHSFQ
jgi:two-component system, chemotaxis family, protein-glutamate methylesterase/glutaminase